MEIIGEGPGEVGSAGNDRMMEILLQQTRMKLLDEQARMEIVEDAPSSTSPGGN